MSMLNLTHPDILEIQKSNWLAERRKGIGGSDAAAILGLNKYITPFALWADKTGRLTEREDNEAMRQGRDFEPYVAKRFTEETGRKVVRSNKILTNSQYPFALANIDRWVLGGGRNTGLECKTTSVLNLKRFKNGEFPPEYYVQCVHYMAVTGAVRWYLAVLVLNSGFYLYEIERDEGEINALMDAEREFWETYVVTDTPPPMDGLAPTTEALGKVFGSSDGEETDIGHLNAELEHLCAVKSQIKALEEQKELAEQKIKLALGESETGYCGRYTVTWKPQARTTLDKKLLIAAHPALDLRPYEKTTTFRTFKVKEEK